MTSGGRRARLLAVVLCVAAAALSFTLPQDRQFTNLDCDLDPAELERDPLGMPECEDAYASTARVSGLVPGRSLSS